MELYQSFLEGIFICGESEVSSVITKEEATLIVDVRAEAKESADTRDAAWVNIPLQSGRANQSQQLKEAIDQVVQAYHKGERAVLH